MPAISKISLQLQLFADYRRAFPRHLENIVISYCDTDKKWASEILRSFYENNNNNTQNKPGS